MYKVSAEDKKSCAVVLSKLELKIIIIIIIRQYETVC